MPAVAKIANDIPSSTPHRWFGLAYLLIFVAGVGFFLLSFIALGVMPGIRLSKTMDSATSLPNYTPAELRGRRLYSSLGCALCHTQQVRYLPADVHRWGPPTAAWETSVDFPQLWGTRRIGPDLARETRIRSHDWQLTHLYDPKSVVPGSVMPNFPWLFNGSPQHPTVAATDLLAYLNTLGRAEQSSAGKPLNPDAETGMDPLMLMQITRLCAAPFIHPNQARIDSSAPDWSDLSQRRTQLVARGQTLYTQNCAGCHGASGDGNGAAAMGLMPKPSNLRQHQFSVQGLAHVLWNGRAGSAMPAWRDLPANDLASLAIYVQGLHTSDNDNTSSSVPLLVQGAVVYARNCVSCHGVQGDGHGLAAIAFLPRPADFTTVQPDTPRILQVLNQGIPGTSMVPWPGLVAADKQAVAAFVRTLYQAKPVSAR